MSDSILRAAVQTHIRTIVGLSVAAMLLVSGCKTSPSKPADREPVLAQCDAKCFAPCVDAKRDTGVRWTADASKPEAWDALAELVGGDLADKLRSCEVNRKACVQCIERAEAQGVLVR